MTDETAVMPSQIVDFFIEQTPPEMLASLLRATLQSYQDSSDHCYETFPPQQAKDVSGPHRRGHIEKELLGIAERFKSFASAETLAYKRRTGSYVEMHWGRIKITESCVQCSKDLPRDAKFRETLAWNGQLGLFGQEESPSEDACLYGILLHGVKNGSGKRERCAFATIRFPNQKFSAYFGGRIDLFAMFPEIVLEFYPAQQDQDEAVRVLPIRIKKVGEA